MEKVSINKATPPAMAGSLDHYLDQRVAAMQLGLVVKWGGV
jgi:hypothetical protein